ncbi:YafY family transcriptional regulator [Xenorhabdus sp. 42]|uniref:helix-turn-helix transcriptional regulator n=1 Tax=Xenorhabdus szentirmaii TaxID=290112 RepID=UPI0019AE0138|nr:MULTISPECIES: YafY family protein [unclassified Xenorhabdus]MBD2781864.1 YafY family transcriptional regulator [Xenorhabdus sp. 38]MBD2793123.1 YafY family transcriptional regulator [Xenorhabdus sp. CUL]MBD2822138.1 YafY family transcriptional regulator [Xenorhabdus sp. 42]MBD2826138.1 YafY family transcriptional regulator [Xenorhabdus sp. 5]
MSRAQRLLSLMEILRGYHFPVQGKVLAQKLNISLRTLYRDIATLQAQGVIIEGEAGIGYVLRPGFVLPPLMLTQNEIEALALGISWVAKRTDLQLKTAANNAINKIAAVIPAELRQFLENSALLVGPASENPQPTVDIQQIRQAIRHRHKITVIYLDLKGHQSERTIWPFALGYFENITIVIGWCELRAEFRHFRSDRIAHLTVEKGCYPRSRQSLLKEWREKEKIPN